MYLAAVKKSLERSEFLLTPLLQPPQNHTWFLSSLSTRRISPRNFSASDTVPGPFGDVAGRGILDASELDDRGKS